jgi:hypothetical protein
VKLAKCRSQNPTKGKASNKKKQQQHQRYLNNVFAHQPIMRTMQNKPKSSLVLLLVMAIQLSLSSFRTYIVVVEAQEIYTDGALFRETFATTHSEEIYSFDGNAELRAVDTDTGSVDANCLRVAYPPSKNGSPRFVKRMDLNEPTSTATLSFDVKLRKHFEFVKGGKMHGLAGGTGTTGCDPIDPDGWSVRMMWREDGLPELYIYHQDRSDDCGDRYPATTGFMFQKNVWYRVDLQVWMNSKVGAGDGGAALYIDGIKHAEANNLNLTGNELVQIDQFMFITFYGGSDRSWAPSKTTYSDFANMVVTPGLIVTGRQGKECEIAKGGIYHFATKLCCARSCGSCGGPGCADLPGGAENCCGTHIPNMCSSRSPAPCRFGGAPVTVPVSAPVAALAPIPGRPAPAPVKAPVPVRDYGKECEEDKGGIFHPTARVCCAKSCGQCGGTGCSKFDGGASNCCMGSIWKPCGDGAPAPCKFY